MKTYVTLSAAIAIAASFGASAPALADTTDCMRITAVPAVLSNEGVYCLDDDMDVSMAGGAAITIASPNVVLDCNGRAVTNDAGSGTYSVGIYANTKLDVTVRNCQVTGFLRGIQLDSGQYTVERNIADGNWGAGIVVSGDGSDIHDNKVLETGGSVLEELHVFVGIQSVGDNDITANTIADVMATTGAGGVVYGIYSEGSDGGTIVRNIVRNLVKDGTGRRRGIWNALTSDVTVWGNIVALGGPGLAPGEVGIRCGDVRNGASRGNTVLGVGAGAGETYGLVNCPEAEGDFVNPL